MNFQINGQTIENHCDNGKGKCCAICKYASTHNGDDGQWIVCSDSCISHNDIKHISCLQCKHKPSWMK